MIEGHRESGRHDAVTARAILRLSHGVSQLTASNNPTAIHRGLFRCRHSKRGRRCDEQNMLHSSPKSYRCVFRDEHPHPLECSHDHVTGSKRKWYSENRHSYQHMSVDSENNTPRRKHIIFHGQNRSFLSSALQEPSLSLQDDDNAMLPEFPSTSSPSCSSMLTHLGSSSATNSPVVFSSDEEQSTASCEHEADVDEKVDEESQRRLPGGQHRRTKLGQPWSSTHISQSVNHIGQTNRSRRQLKVPFSGGSNTTIAGDSSDGLSVKLKIPRLSSVPTALQAASSAVSTRRNRRKDNGNGWKCRYCETSTANLTWQHNGPVKDGDWRHCSSSSSHKDGKPGWRSSLCTHKPRNTPRDRCTTFTRGSSTSSGSPSPRSGSRHRFGAGYRASDSGEDLANDEQSDFPADELPPRFLHLGNPLYSSHDCMRILHPRSQGRHVSSTSNTRVLSSATASYKNHRISELPGPTPVAKSLFPGPTNDQQQIDSELEEIMDGTWPLLSNRAKAAYLQGVSRTGMRPTDKVLAPGSQSALPTYSAPPPIQFVPSVLGQVIIPDPEELSVSQTSSSKSWYTSVPPWEREDMDEDVPLDFQEPAVSNVSARDSTIHFSNTHHPTVDSWRPTVSICPPLSETNVGHRMLQKLGWTPGIGLGLQSQGILTPIGCSISPKRTCGHMGIERQ